MTTSPRAHPDRDVDVALRVLRTGGAGPGAARNAGARAARGTSCCSSTTTSWPSRDSSPLTGDGTTTPSTASSSGSRARPTSGTLVAQAMALWWREHFARKERAIALTFATS